MEILNLAIRGNSIRQLMPDQMWLGFSHLNGVFARRQMDTPKPLPISLNTSTAGNWPFARRRAKRRRPALGADKRAPTKHDISIPIWISSRMAYPTQTIGYHRYNLCKLCRYPCFQVPTSELITKILSNQYMKIGVIDCHNSPQRAMGSLRVSDPNNQW